MRDIKHRNCKVGQDVYFNRSIGTKQTPQYTINLALLDNKECFCKDAGTFSKGGHLPLSNLQTVFKDVFSLSLKVLPLWDGLSRWMKEAKFSQHLHVKSLVFERCSLVLVVLEHRPLVYQTTALELGSL